VGDIDPPRGDKVLVEVEVRPRRGGVDPGTLAAALAGTGVAAIAMAPMPVVRSSSAIMAETVDEEIGSTVQGLEVPATDAVVDDNELATDGRRLESIYASRGYFQAKVFGQSLEAVGADGVRVVFEMVENQPTRVLEIHFAGACEGVSDDPEAGRRLNAICAEAHELVPMRIGDIWEERVYVEGLEVLERTLRDAGFLHATVKGDNWVSKDRLEAAVWYRLDPGPLVRATGPVEVSQNPTVSTARILRRVEIDEGAVIDADLVERTERDVIELGPFFSAQLQPVRDDGAAERPGKMRLALQVAEAPKWEFSVGPSVVSDFIRLEMALPARFVHRNLFGDLVSLEAKAKPALVLPNCFTGESCTDESELGIDSKLTLQIPSFFEEYLKLALELLYRRDPSQDTKSAELGGSLGVSRRIIEGLTARLGYNLSSFDYFDSSALDNVPTAEAIGHSALRFKSGDLLAWLDLALILDLRDAPLDARRGFYGALSVQLAEPWLGSDVTYLRTLTDLRAYFTPRALPWLSLASRVRVGWNFFDADAGTPQPARFKSGGATTMRGFATDRIGDFVCATPGPTGSYLENPACGEGSTDRTYIGGNYLLEGNLELRFRLRDGLGLAAFVDIGRVWSLLADVDPSALHVAVGPGLRYDLPVGPVRIDFGFLLGKRPATELHISLGQAF
jgi:translocation and assembly module TamA